MKGRNFLIGCVLTAIASLLSVTTSRTSQAAAPTEPQPATSVQLDRYLGKWFEIRSVPNTFQEGCTNTTAEYELEPEGTIKVTNNCRVVDTDGMFEKNTSVIGRGWVKNQDNSILKVSFSCVLGYCLENVSGDYWILELGPLNADGLYSWAIVGGPTRQFGWILSRESTIDDATMTEIETLLRAQGYNPAAFRTTLQNQQ